MLKGLCQILEFGDNSIQDYIFFICRLGFLPDTARSDAELYFRSTNVPRTFESLYQIVHGLYPSEKRVDGYVPQLLIRYVLLCCARSTTKLSPTCVNEQQ